MALHRCAACGSPNVVVEKEKDGYNFKKGLLGTVVFGAAGAVAGINGKTKEVYKCPDCGLTLNEDMPLGIKILIDNAVTSPYIRDKLTLNGRPISWEYLVSKYKNIETSKIQYGTSPNNTAETYQPNTPTIGQVDEVLEHIKDEILIELKNAPDGLSIIELQASNQFLQQHTIPKISRGMVELWKNKIVERYENGKRVYFKLPN